MKPVSSWSARGAACLGAAALVCACGPEDSSGTVRAYVYQMDPATHAYALGIADVEHLESLRELRGRDIDVRRGAEFNMTLAGIEVKRGSPFSLEYTVRDDGVVVPGDMHSFYALSMYRNFDRIASFMRGHRFVPAARLDVLYFPRIDNVLMGDQRSSLTDNAAFAFEARGFLIVPSFVLSDLPMFLNEGVMAHEYGHAIIHQLLFPSGVEPASDAHLLAMHEGVADLIGFAETGDPNYILPTADADRDLSVPRTYTSEEYSALLTSQNDVLPTWDPHADGSTMARAIYELWPKDAGGKIAETERLRMLDVVLAALGSITYQEGAFTLGTFPDALVAQLPPADQAAACAVLTSRLAPLSAALTNCGAP